MTVKANQSLALSSTLTQEYSINLVDPALPQFAVMDRHTRQQALVNLAAIYLSRLVNLPIEQIEYREHFGRIVVVEYQPFGYADPILPIPMVDLGQEFFSLFSGFALHVQEWQPLLYVDDIRKWTTKANAQVSAVAASPALQALSPNEKQYFLFNLALSVARPVRY